MSVAAPTLTWEQYQQLPPELRSRPLTPAEYAALTQQQRIAGGLEDPSEGAPQNFNGPVFPNPDHLRPQLDTDPAIPATRLPQGVTFQKQNWSGTPQMDVSNPAATQALPEQGREIAANFSGAAKADSTKSDSTKSDSSVSANTVPMFSPDGTLGDIPYEQMKSALAAGARPGVTVKAPDGTLGVVPSERAGEAVKAGGQIVPFEQQETQHPGFWHSLYSDLSGMVEGAAKMAPDVMQAAGGSPEALGRDVGNAASTVKQNYQQRSAQNRSLPYKVGAAANEALGVNVRGEEQSAEEGDPGGVLGHAAAVPVTMGAGEALRAVAPVITDAARSALDSPGGKAATAAAKAAAKKLPAAAIRRIPYVGDVASDVYSAGSEAAARARGAATPELDATGENKPFAGGPDEPPPAKTPKGLDATGENKPFAGGTDEPPIVRPKKAAAKVESPATSAAPAAEPSPRAAAPAATTSPEPAAAAAAPKRTVVIDPQTGAPEFSDVVAAKQKAAPPAAAATTTTDPILARLQQQAAKIEAAGKTAEPEVPSPDNEDLTDILQRSLAHVEAKKGAPVFTTAAPKDLLDRWGVDEDSFAEGRSQTRGMKADESAAAIKKLTQAYKNGQPVEPLLETRDANNNIIDADGRGRALAAHKAGVERVPIIVRRIGAPAAPIQ